MKCHRVAKVAFREIVLLPVRVILVVATVGLLLLPVYVMWEAWRSYGWWGAVFVAWVTVALFGGAFGLFDE